VVPDLQAELAAERRKFLLRVLRGARLG
jgi:hypothetical protein